MTASTPSPRALLLSVLLLTFLAYAPSLGNGFAMDDVDIAMGTTEAGTPNALVHDLWPITKFFETHYWAGTQVTGDLFRPVTNLSYAVRHALFGDAAWVAHLVNIALHLLAVVLVWRLLERLKVGLWATAAGAAVFGLHAVHSEVTATVVGRAELFAFVFGAGALLLLRGSLLQKLLSGVLLFLAFGSKESALAWVPFFFVFECAIRWRESRKSIPVEETLVLVGRIACVVAAPVAAFLGLRASMLGALPIEPSPAQYYINPLAHVDIDTRLGTSVMIGGWALVLTFAPFWLAADYGPSVFPLLEDLGDWRALLSLAASLALVIGGVLVRRKHPLLFLAVATWFGFHFLTSNIPLPIGTVFGERLLYTPSLACSFLVAWLFERADGRALRIATSTWLAACAVVILMRNGVWKDDETLFLHAAENQPRSVRMLACAADVHRKRGEFEPAIALLERAVELEPEYTEGLGQLGAMLIDSDQLDAAEPHLRAALASPHAETIHKAAIYSNLSRIMKLQDRVDDLIKVSESALADLPNRSEYFSDLLTLVKAKLMMYGALESFLLGQRALTKDPIWDRYLAELKKL